MRTFFRVKWTIVINKRHDQEFAYKIDREKLLQNHPFLKNTNVSFSHGIFAPVNTERGFWDRRSKERQRRIFQYLLDSGKEQSKAAIARRFGVSRVWVSKVMNR
jgi:hypothetical protein